MSGRKKKLTTHLFRLVHLARSAEMKRALTTIDPQPGLNFWRLIHGNQLDVAVLEWCKVFGSDGEETHWKKIVPSTEQDLFRNNLFTSLGITPEQWATYWTEMKEYRDSLVAHHIELNGVQSYPDLDIALRSSFFYYSYLIRELRSLGETKYPDDLQTYCIAFERQACEIAELAMAATAKVNERVY